MTSFLSCIFLQLGYQNITVCRQPLDISLRPMVMLLAEYSFSSRGIFGLASLCYDAKLRQLIFMAFISRIVEIKFTLSRQ